MNPYYKLYKDGMIKFNVEFKPILNVPIICVDHGTWYKFNIDEIEKLDDGTYNVISNTLLSIDNINIK